MKRTFLHSTRLMSWRAGGWGAVLALPLVVCAACVEIDSRQVLPAELGSGGSSVTQGGALSSGGSVNPGGGTQNRGGSGGSTSIAGSASGGVSSTGGHGGAGAGGGGGVSSGGVSGGGTPGVCLQIKGDATQPLIDDLDDGDGQIAQQAQRVGSWFTYNDLTNCTQKPVPMSQFLPVMGGANGTLYAANMNGTGCTDWGAGMGFDLNRGNGVPNTVECPYDLGPYAGLEFWAKSATSTSFNVLVPLTTTTDVPLGGKCVPTTVQCDDHYRKEITNITPTWTEYKVFWTDLKQYGFGVPAAFDPTQVVGIRFETLNGPTVTTPYDLSVDQITFF